VFKDKEERTLWKCGIVTLYIIREMNFVAGLLETIYRVGETSRYTQTIRSSDSI
jgi:hypothetical protein